jgi:hypothetical protein
MKLVEINWQPTDRQLSQFGLMSLAALPVIGWLWHASSATITGLTAVGAVFAVVGLLQPRLLKYPFLGLTLLTMPIGLVVGELVLLLIYFGLFLPIGMFFRLIGRDALERGLDRHAQTYWQAKAQPAGPASYLRQS